MFWLGKLGQYSQVNTTQHNNKNSALNVNETERYAFLFWCCYDECHHAEYSYSEFVMMSVAMLSILILRVAILILLFWLL
jgi:hypothetical protein